MKELGFPESISDFFLLAKYPSHWVGITSFVNAMQTLLTIMCSIRVSIPIKNLKCGIIHENFNNSKMFEKTSKFRSLSRIPKHPPTPNTYPQNISHLKPHFNFIINYSILISLD